MNEAIQLDYSSTPCRPWSLTAIFAFILGLCSGPIIVLAVRYSRIAYGISIVGGIIAAVVGIVIGAYCLWAFARLAGRERPRGRILALIGLIATIVWTVGLVSLFFYIESQLN